MTAAGGAVVMASRRARRGCERAVLYAPLMEKLRLERRPEARAFGVETLLQHVRDGKVRVPDFQRPLRWRGAHVLDLFDSVYRGFPVGDLLFFKRSAEAAAIHVGAVVVHAPAVAEAYFVVDGQQRITALAGAMLHPEPRPQGDIFAVWFDLEEEHFVRVRSAEPPPQWIPLNVVGDSFALLNWLHEWPFRSQRPDLVQRAIGLGKALREYQIPAYIVEGASDDVLRLIFKRVNTSGVAMEESEVFTALFHGGEAHPIESACARLQTSTGFGALSADWFLGCLEAVEGLHVARELTEGQVAKLDPRAVERTESALLRVIRFLLDDAEIVHLQLLPYFFPHDPLVVLSRFFHLHPRPSQRARTLLSRWLWRGALGGGQFGHGNDIQRVSRLLVDDEFASVERLLASIPDSAYTIAQRASLAQDWIRLGPSPSTPWRHTDAQFCALALAHLGSRDPETGKVLGSDEVRALLENESVDDIFLDVEGLTESTAVRRVLVSSRLKIKKLSSASLEILESHGLDQEAADALGRGDIATFVERRTPILDRWFRRFFAERIGADDGDRPPVAELIRRVDRALTVS